MTNRGNCCLFYGAENCNKDWKLSLKSHKQIFVDFVIVFFTRTICLKYRPLCRGFLFGLLLCPQLEKWVWSMWIKLCGYFKKDMLILYHFSHAYHSGLSGTLFFATKHIPVGCILPTAVAAIRCMVGWGVCPGGSLSRGLCLGGSLWQRPTTPSPCGHYPPATSFAGDKNMRLSSIEGIRYSWIKDKYLEIKTLFIIY